ncbi:MAG: M1 family metallopeptidase [Anaerolineae bacterium]|nr:M1 family metallopeptidase [Anaerolineae bacterium]
MSTIQPQNTPTLPLTPSLPAPQVKLPDVSLYHQAMLPQFAADVDQIVAEGASRYNIEAILDFETTDTKGQPKLTGSEQIYYTNNEDVPLDEIVFRLYPNLPGYGGQMKIDTVRVDEQAITPTLDSNETALRVPLPAPLLSGEAVDISLSFEATLPTHTDEGYNIFSFTEGTAALAGFYPVIATYDDEGWDREIPPTYGDATYLDIALFQVHLTVPTEMIVAASGSLIDSRDNGDGTKTLTLVTGPMRDFYIAMAEDFQIASQVVDGITVNSYYPPALAEGGQAALHYAVDAFALFNQRFGPYPYAEFDVIATPTTAGGVEYPGIVVIAEGLYDQPGGFFEHATVHEVVHQWWYGLVGNDQIDAPWLDESLTNYSTALYWEEIHGAETSEMVINSYFKEPYEYAKANGGNRAITDSVSEYTEAEYSAFIYGKGPLFFNALRQELGDDRYFEVMKTYLARYKYKNATKQDLIETIEQTSGQNIEPLLETWLETR